MSLLSFSWLTEIMLQGLERKICFFCLAGVLIFAKSWPQMIQQHKQDYACIPQAGLTLNPKKCQVAQKGAPSSIKCVS